MDKMEFNLKLLQIGNSDRELIIKGIKFELDRENRIVALIGESGLGKTTIYKSLFSTYISLWKKEHPIKFVCNHNINGLEYSNEDIEKGTIKPNFGFATQVPYFFNYKTVEDNLFYPLKWLNEVDDSKEFRKKYLNKFKLEDLQNEEMNHLSGGQRQMVNIARVFLSNPELVIIDESLSNLDESKAKEYINLILTNYPQTFIFLTSHRETDISYCKAKKIYLVKKQDEAGSVYITMN